MLRSYLISALRNLIKHKGSSFIHIAGLAIGLTAGIYVIHYARLEHGYDLFHHHVNQIYRVVTTRVKDGVDLTKFSSTYSGVGPAMADEYPEVENYTRMFHRWRGGIISHGETRFREQKIYHVDSGFFQVFSFPVVEGSASDLQKPGMAFVEEATAKKYFGIESPIGKRITFGSVDGLEEYEIRGVVQCPESSSIKFNFLFSYHDLGRLFGTDHISSWVWLDFHTFIKLNEGTDIKNLEGRFTELLKKNRGNRAANSRLSLQPFPDIYLQSKTEFETGLTGDAATVRILLVLGFIIIAIVWLNFINLSTSHALARAKEVGIRKTIGSSRQNLVFQFLIETTLINLIALVAASILLWALLPYFSQLTGRYVNFGAFAVEHLWKYLIVFFLIGTVAIGIYPALKLSSFRPVEVLKGSFTPKSHGAWLRDAFVGLQALVSFSLVASILIIIDQVNHVSSQKLGIAIDNTLAVRTPEVMMERGQYLSSLDTYKAELLKDARIGSVSTTADSPGEDVNWIGGTRKLGADIADNMSFFRAIIDADFLSTMELKIVAGRGFTKQQSTLDILLNQTGVRSLGFERDDESIGQQIILGADTCTVVGVLQDFHQVSPREAIAPTVFHNNLETPRIFLIKFANHSPQEIITMAQTTFLKLFPNEPFDYYLLDEFYDSQYTSERKLKSIITVFCLLAVFVSSLGLLGLTWFRISRQKKELAVRKIIGSTNWQLFYNASARLFLTTFVGCAIGIPVTWYIMGEWLQSFSLHTQPKIWQFSLALVTSLLISLITVSSYTLKVIRTNPVHHLKRE